MQYHEFDTHEESLSFIKDYCSFGPNRLYLLLALARPKENEGITHNSIPMFREIISHEDKIESKYNKLKLLSENYNDGELKFRFYLSANARDLSKSFYLYQKELLEMQRHKQNGHEGITKKQKRLDQEWKSTLQKAGNKSDNYFIIDIDNEDESILENIKNGLEEETNAIECIKTPNGFHLITEPFDYTDADILNEEYIETKTDDLFFLFMN